MSLSRPGSEKWLLVPKNRDELLSVTRDLITEVRELSDATVKLQKLKGNEELTNKLDEVLSEIDTQFDKIIATVHSSDMVYTHLKGLRATIEKIYQFFEDLQQTRVLFFAKGRLRKQMILHYNSLRHNCTQLMASVSLELLSKEPDHPPPSEPLPDLTNQELEREVLEGHKFFYGIHKFKNYLRAFKHYVYAAERDHLDAMIMVGLMYQHGYGLDQDLSKAIAWYKRAEALGSANAKYCLAFLILDEVTDRRPLPLSLTTDSTPSPLPSLQLRVDLFRAKYHILDGHSVFSSQSERNHSPPAFASAGAAPHRLSLPKNDREEGTEEGDEEMIREDQLQRATKLLMEGAEMGCTNAQTALGQLFEMEDDYEAAKRWSPFLYISSPLTHRYVIAGMN
jgi:hypothetical protein